METNNKMREALEALNSIDTRGLKRLLFELVEADIFDHGQINKTISAVDRAKAALAAPRLNCEVGTADEQALRHHREFCRVHHSDDFCCAQDSCMYCFSRWAQTPYGANEKGEAMTLTAEQSSNKAEYEAAPTAEIIDIIRTAMGEGCIRPCHVYDAVDELICRIQALENRPKRNCDVGAPKEQNERYNEFCHDHRSHERCCGDCPLNGEPCCELAWAQMAYVEKEGGDK